MESTVLRRSRIVSVVAMSSVFVMTALWQGMDRLATGFQGGVGSTRYVRFR
jgi:hypothetical protein